MNDLHSPALSDNLQKNMSKEESSALGSYEVEFAEKVLQIQSCETQFSFLMLDTHLKPGLKSFWEFEELSDSAMTCL